MDDRVHVQTPRRLQARDRSVRKVISACRSLAWDRPRLDSLNTRKPSTARVSRLFSSPGPRCQGRRRVRSRIPGLPARAGQGAGPMEGGEVCTEGKPRRKRLSPKIKGRNRPLKIAGKCPSAPLPPAGPARRHVPCPAQAQAAAGRSEHLFVLSERSSQWWALEVTDDAH